MGKRVPAMQESTALPGMGACKWLSRFLSSFPVLCQNSYWRCQDQTHRLPLSEVWNTHPVSTSVKSGNSAGAAEKDWELGQMGKDACSSFIMKAVHKLAWLEGKEKAILEDQGGICNLSLNTPHSLQCFCQKTTRASASGNETEGDVSEFKANNSKKL